MSAILWRELRLLLASPSGAALLAVWTFLCGALFLVELSAWEQAQQRALQIGDPAVLGLLDFNDLLLAAVQNHLVVVLLFIGPLLGARLFADGPTRDWLVQAAPSSTSLVLGKLLAGAVVVGVLVGTTLAFPLFLAVAGQGSATGAGAEVSGAVVDVAQTVLASVTLWLAGTSFVAVAAVIAARAPSSSSSSAASSALVAALGSFLLLTVLWLLPGAAPLAGPVVADVVTFISPASHVERGLRGIFAVDDVIWFCGLIAGCATGAVVALDGARR